MMPEAESKEIKRSAGCAIAVIAVSLLLVGALTVVVDRLKWPLGAGYYVPAVVGIAFFVVLGIRWLSKPLPEPQAWRCEACTAMNRAEMQVCAGCDKERKSA